MQFSALVVFASAAALVASAPTDENGVATLNKRYDIWLGCCNPKNNYAWKQDTTTACCGEAKGTSASWTALGRNGCQLFSGDVGTFDGCCNRIGRTLGTPDFDSCIINST